MEIEEAPFTRFADSEAAELFARVQAREVWAMHGRWAAENMKFLLPDVAKRLKRAELLSRSSDGEIKADAEALGRYRDDYENLVSPGTAILLPVMAGLPPLRRAAADELSEFRAQSFRWTAPSSLTGSPQIVAPVVHCGSGLSYGVGLIGARGDDQSLLAAMDSVLGRQPQLDSVEGGAPRQLLP